jgi:hypothetical protein
MEDTSAGSADGQAERSDCDPRGALARAQGAATSQRRAAAHGRFPTRTQRGHPSEDLGRSVGVEPGRTRGAFAGDAPRRPRLLSHPSGRSRAVRFELRSAVPRRGLQSRVISSGRLSGVDSAQSAAKGTAVPRTPRCSQAERARSACGGRRWAETVTSPLQSRARVGFVAHRSSCERTQEQSHVRTHTEG